MASVLLAPAFDELIDYLIERATPQEIMAFELSQTAQDRAAELVDRNNAGTLTPMEQIELEQMLHFEERIAILKAQAAGELKRKL